jgi:NADP-dependent 3-hydroxy acid dehydrogenase YdfG
MQAVASPDRASSMPAISGRLIRKSYSREIDVNLKGLLNRVKAVLAGMIESKSGTIVNISS